ncbi:MAG: DNA gyrase inhibitor YacG [Duodenibacillus sp.]|nr:DNA gyrase inhibitor YacG [Duodenibacillus sp.]
MQVKCPTCKRRAEYDGNPWRPFCCERCKLIDLGRWAAGDYRIEGVPGSADPDALAEQLEALERRQRQEDEGRQ